MGTRPESEEKVGAIGGAGRRMIPGGAGEKWGGRAGRGWGEGDGVHWGRDCEVDGGIGCCCCTGSSCWAACCCPRDKVDPSINSVGAVDPHEPDAGYILIVVMRVAHWESVRRRERGVSVENVNYNGKLHYNAKRDRAAKKGQHHNQKKVRDEKR